MNLKVTPPSDTDFGELYSKYYDRVTAWTRRFGVPADEVEDYVSESFTRAWRSYGKFRGEASFSTWLYQILRNIVYDRRRVRSEELKDVERASEAESPDVLYESRDIARRIDEALVVLSSSQRQVFLMKENDGLKHGEIAEKLGISPGTSKVHYFNALRKLRGELDDLKQ